MIINIRGTSGAGKSTLVQKVMALYASKAPLHVEGRKRPIGYMLGRNIGGGQIGGKSLGVLGHYEIACGGCDTLKTIDAVYDQVRDYVHQGADVLYEGLMPGEDVARAVKLSQEVGRENFLVIDLTTDIEECIRRVKQRRAAKGNEKPLNEKNTRSRALGYARRRARLRDAGVVVETLSCEDAFEVIRMRFKL